MTEKDKEIVAFLILALYFLLCGFLCGYIIKSNFQDGECIDLNRVLIELSQKYSGQLNDCMDMNEGYHRMINKEDAPVVTAENADPDKGIEQFVVDRKNTSVIMTSPTASCVYACREPAPEGVPCLMCCYPIRDIDARDGR